MRVRKSCFLIVFVLLTIFCSLLPTYKPIKPALASPEDWLAGWDYRKSHVLINATGAGTDYQVKIKVNYEEEELGTSFEKDPDNPFNLPGDDDGYGAVHPTAMYFPSGEDGYKYWLFYEKGLSGPDCDIYLVRSNDGETWTETGVSNPIITSAGGSTHCPDPEVLKVGSTWLLYIVGGVGGATSIYRFMSYDGKSWVQSPSGSTYVLTRGGAGAWDEDDVTCPSVFYEGGTYYMFYTGEDSNVYKLGLATSANGIDFSKSASNPIHEYASGGIWHHCVEKYDNKYWLYWTGDDAPNDAIKLATSTNKIDWTNYDGNPVMEKSGSGWETTKLYTPEWTRDGDGNGLLIDGEIKFVYSAYGTTEYKIGYATSSIAGNEVSLGGKCQTDFDDVRFTDDDETTLLDYWLEKKVDSNYAIFWVKVKDNLSSANQTIYLYYGEQAVSSSSSGSATMIWCDDFEDGTLGQPPSTWTIENNNIVIANDRTVSSQSIKHTDNTGTDRSTGRKDIAINSSVALHYAWQGDEIYDDNQYQYAFYVRQGAVFKMIHLLGRYAKFQVDGSGGVADVQNVANDTWYHVEVKDINSTHHRIVVNDQDRGFFDNKESLGSPDRLNVTDSGGSPGDGKLYWWDNFFVRKYVSPEPSHGAWGSEESAPDYAYNYVVHGPYYETGSVANAFVNVTLERTNTTSYYFILNGTDGVADTIEVGTVNQPIAFFWNISTGYNKTRVLYLTSATYEEIWIHVPNPDEPYYLYTFTVTDFVGVTNAFLETIRNVGGQNRVVERQRLDVINAVPFWMVWANRYDIKLVCDQGSYVWGGFIALTEQDQGLVITVGMFAITYPGVNVTVSAQRMNATWIRATYTDTELLTSWVKIDVQYKEDYNWTTFYTRNQTGNSHVVDLYNVTSGTDYVTLVFAYRQATLYTWSFSCPKPQVTENPFQGLLDTMGNWPIPAESVIGLFVVLAVLGVFSYHNMPLGCILAVIVAGFLTLIGWLNLGWDLLALGFSVGILAAISKAKRMEREI